ncbi:esterase-like activity of phytase family protein [Aurantiacibacter spongiae]|uniref:esterase-like activity of phytase family protein n=1 Tax=Aurantiacibacter spongiae TaxID=2488860 RepID=UPI00131581DC|nr:esterase-like activity of phytase family protein [Aurantiacibacter spongiae]
MRHRRIAAIAALVLGLAPSTWLRSEVVDGKLADFRITPLSDFTSDPVATGVRIEGVWEIQADNLQFGGYSALLPLAGGHLRAFSDRGYRLTFPEPGARGRFPTLSRQLALAPYAPELWDIESATRDPDGGDYWLGYESTHAFQRFSNASTPMAVRLIGGDVNWPSNSGAESLVRLADGRFLVLPESGRDALIYRGDPVETPSFATSPVSWPIAGYNPTDAAQLPDGRVIILMRRVAWGFPPFSSLLVIADPATLQAGQPWNTYLLARLDRLVPSENYEGLAVRRAGRDAAEIWMISDDNRSAFQRTLLVRMRLDYASGKVHQKARESR